MSWRKIILSGDCEESALEICLPDMTSSQRLATTSCQYAQYSSRQERHKRFAVVMVRNLKMTNPTLVTLIILNSGMDKVVCIMRENQKTPYDASQSNK